MHRDPGAGQGEERRECRMRSYYTVNIRRNDVDQVRYTLFLETLLAATYPVHPHASDDPSLHTKLWASSLSAWCKKRRGRVERTWQWGSNSRLAKAGSVKSGGQSGMSGRFSRARLQTVMAERCIRTPRSALVDRARCNRSYGSR